MHHGATCRPGSPQDRRPLEERRERDPVSNGERHERGEAHIRSRVLDDREVLGVKPCQLGSLFLGQSALFTKLSKSKAQAALRGLDRLLQGGSKTNL